VRKKNNKQKKFDKEKVDKHKKRYPNGGVKKCLRCDKDFLSSDVITNRICVDCSRHISKEWLPDVYNSGVNPSQDVDDWF
jgi:hypothetical protein